MMLIALHEKAFPMANVAVIRAVFGNTKEYHVMEKIKLPRLAAEQCAKTAIKKKKMASLDKYCEARIHAIISRKVDIGILSLVPRTPKAKEQQNLLEAELPWQRAPHHP
jgi:hypothetical protein